MKHVKILFAVLGLAVIVTGSFAFTSKSFHKRFAATEYQFNTSVTPTNSSVIVSGNYTIVTSRTCPLPRLKYCDITIDPSVHPEYVTTGGALNFSNSTLVSTVQANFGTVAEGTIVNGITFH